MTCSSPVAVADRGEAELAAESRASTTRPVTPTSIAGGAVGRQIGRAPRGRCQRGRVRGKPTGYGSMPAARIRSTFSRRTASVPAHQHWRSLTGRRLSTRRSGAQRRRHAILRSNTSRSPMRVRSGSWYVDGLGCPSRTRVASPPVAMTAAGSPSSADDAADEPVDLAGEAVDHPATAAPRRWSCR